MKDDYVYGNVAVELSEIFKHLDISIVSKIPKNLRDSFKKLENKEYKFKYDVTKDLKDQKIMEETKDLFSSLFLGYCCDDNLKKELLKKCKENNSNIELQHGIEGVFDNKENVKAKAAVPVKVEEKVPFFKRVINKIKSFFRK